MLVFPAPLGAAITMIFPRTGMFSGTGQPLHYSMFCTCSRILSNSSLMPTTR